MLKPRESYALVSAEPQTYEFVKNHLLRINREVGVYDYPTLFGEYIEVADKPETDLFITKEPTGNCNILDLSDSKTLYKVFGSIIGKTDNKPKKLNKRNQVLHYMCIYMGEDSEYYSNNEYKSREQAIFDFAESINLRTFHYMVEVFDNKMSLISGFLSSLMQFPEKQNFVMARMRPEELKTLQDRLLKLAILILKYRTLNELELYLGMCAES